MMKLFGSTNTYYIQEGSEKKEKKSIYWTKFIEFVFQFVDKNHNASNELSA